MGGLVLDEAEASHGPVDGQRVDEVEIVHAGEVQQEVAAQVVADDVGAVVLGEQQTGLVHLVVGYEPGREHLVLRTPFTFNLLNWRGSSNAPALHDVEVPQLHDLLLPLVDVGELLDLLRREQRFVLGHTPEEARDTAVTLWIHLGTDLGGLLSEPVRVPLVLAVQFHLLRPQRHAAVAVEVQAVVSADVGPLLLPLALLRLQELRQTRLGPFKPGQT